jgi:hypothetical protein
MKTHSACCAANCRPRVEAPAWYSTGVRCGDGSQRWMGPCCGTGEGGSLPTPTGSECGRRTGVVGGSKGMRRGPGSAVHVILHYRRAPEHVHPAPVDDAVTAYRWLLDQGVAPRHIALTGDSAGGALAVTTLLRARERNLPVPAATMPLSPWVDLEITGETLVSNREKDAIVQKEVVEVMSTTFLGEGGNRKDPLANPLYADLKGLPPMYIPFSVAGTAARASHPMQGRTPPALPLRCEGRTLRLRTDAPCPSPHYLSHLSPGGWRRDPIGRQPPARGVCQKGRRRCTRIAKSTAIWPRRSAAGR